MPKKEECPKCKKFKFLRSDGLCVDCAPSQKQTEPEVQYDLTARNTGTYQDVMSSLAYLQAHKVRAMYVGEMTQTSRAFGTLNPSDMGWATEVAEVLKNNFICVVGGVFTGLVIFEGSGMVFTLPRQSEHGEGITAPSISLVDLKVWQAKLGCGDRRDWTCVICHEVIHYLHWRWTILPCDAKYLDQYEDQVSGQVAPGECKLPGFYVKEKNGLKELQNPPVPFTENGFRQKYGVGARKGYCDLSNFAKL